MTSSGTALIVGATSAIGAAVARRLAASGSEPLLWGRNEARLAEAAAGCGRPVTTAQVDLRDRELVDRLCAGLGPELRSVVVAVGLFDWADVLEADPDAWAELFQVNLAGVAHLARRLAPVLVRSAPSRLVLVGSLAAHRAFAHNAAYVASKHGLAGLARALFLDLRDRGVGVTLLSPGPVNAGAGARSPAGLERPEQLLQPEDVADAVEFALGLPARACASEILLEPQRDPG